MSQSQDSVPILTLSNRYAWKKRAVNAFANFGEADKAIINKTPYVFIELCQSPMIKHRQQYLYSIDKLTKIHIADRPWSDTMEWSTLVYQVVE